MVMQLWHQTAKVKAKAVADYVKELLMNSDPDDKCLVFAYHRWGGLCVEKTPYRIVH